MTLKLSMALFLVMPSFCCADGSNFAEAATSFAATIQNYVPSSTAGIPGYVGANVPETQHNEKTLESAKYQAAAQSPAYQMIRDSIDQRAPYDLDVINDPIFKQANAILSKAEDKDTASSQSEPMKTTIHKCLRGRSRYEAQCKRLQVPQQIDTRLEEKTITINLSGLAVYKSGQMATLVNSRRRQQLSPTHPTVIAAFKAVFNGVDGMSGQKIDLNLNALTSVTFKRAHGGHIHYFYEKSRRSSSELIGERYMEFQVITKVEVPVFKLVWQEDCKTLESLIDQGECELVSTRCLNGPATRVIDGVPLSSECWEEELTYRCHGKSENTCTSLLEKGCVQVSSTCKIQEGDQCLQWEQTYECYEGKLGRLNFQLPKDKPFCVDGDCVNQSWAPNQDMADSLSKLAIFRDMHKTMDPDTQKIFKGEAYQCSRNPASYKNCCVQKGWGMKIGLAQCSETEKKLAEQRQANKCIAVGTYCAKKEFGLCTEKRTSFCCYPTKMARIIQQQGRAQLGLSFGSPRSPTCDQLTLSDFMRIDFSKINFSELFEDILNKTNLPNPQPVAQGIQRSLQDGSRLVTDKQKKITQGRANDSF